MGKIFVLWKNMWKSCEKVCGKMCEKVSTILKNFIVSIKNMCRSGRCTHYLHMISTIVYTLKNSKNTLIAARFYTVSTRPTTTTTNIFIERSF